MAWKRGILGKRRASLVIALLAVLAASATTPASAREFGLLGGSSAIPAPGCEEDAEVDLRICLDTPPPYMVPQTIEFRISSNTVGPGDEPIVRWEQDFWVYAERLTLVAAGPPGGMSTYRAILPGGQATQGNAWVTADDGKMNIYIANGFYGYFEADALSPLVGDPTIKHDPKYKRNKEGKRLVSLASTTSFEGRRDLHAVSVLKHQGNAAGEWSTIAEVSSAETVGSGSRTVGVGPLKARCPSDYKKCRFRLDVDLFAFEGGELWQVAKAGSLSTKFITKPKQ